MASLPNAAFREWSVIDDIGMRSTEGALESPSEAIVAPSQSLRRFIELVPGDGGRHFANGGGDSPSDQRLGVLQGSQKRNGYVAPRVVGLHRYVFHAQLRFKTVRCREDNELLPEQLLVLCDCRSHHRGALQIPAASESVIVRLRDSFAVNADGA